MFGEAGAVAVVLHRPADLKLLGWEPMAEPCQVKEVQDGKKTLWVQTTQTNGERMRRQIFLGAPLAQGFSDRTRDIGPIPTSDHSKKLEPNHP
jgi:hypothetical protein